jgi:hypothetical protein
LAVACIALSILAAAKLFGSRNADPASVSPSRSESIPVERGKP